MVCTVRHAYLDNGTRAQNPTLSASPQTLLRNAQVVTLIEATPRILTDISAADLRKRISHMKSETSPMGSQLAAMWEKDPQVAALRLHLLLWHSVKCRTLHHRSTFALLHIYLRIDNRGREMRA